MAQLKIKCSKCGGTGKMSYEDGPRGATTTVYHECYVCDGSGYLSRPDRTDPEGGIPGRKL